jgi:VWFA-related protein
MMKIRLAIAMLLSLLPGLPMVRAQSPTTPPTGVAGDDAQVTTLTARTTLVLVPALVTKNGEPVFTLQAKDFVVTDDGIPQQVTLEEDTGGEPLALVVVVETGGSGARQVEKYRKLGTLVEAVVGGVPHKVAVVEFDSTADVTQPFTEDLAKVDHTLQTIDVGDVAGAIYDALGLAVRLLGKQPETYRRAILLISETNDHGSKLKEDDAIKTISDTNTAIYSMGFSSTKADIGKEASGFSSADPGPPGGCMAKDPNEDPAAHKNKAEQGYDCLSLLAPPLRLAKMAVIAVRDGFRKNVPETVAHVSGGEYFSFGNEKSLDKDLIRLSNHMANHYVLSFHPQAPHVGFHAISVKLSEYTGVTVTGRTGYWVDGDTAAPSPSKQ